MLLIALPQDTRKTTNDSKVTQGVKLFGLQ